MINQGEEVDIADPIGLTGTWYTNFFNSMLDKKANVMAATLEVEKTPILLLTKGYYILKQLNLVIVKYGEIDDTTGKPISTLNLDNRKVIDPDTGDEIKIKEIAFPSLTVAHLHFEVRIKERIGTPVKNIYGGQNPKFWLGLSKGIRQ